MSCSCLVFKDVLMVFPEPQLSGPADSWCQHSDRAKPLSALEVTSFPAPGMSGRGNSDAKPPWSNIRNGYSACNNLALKIWTQIHPNTIQDLIFGIEQHVIGHVWHSWFKLLQLVESNLPSPPWGMEGVSIKEVDFGFAVSCLVFVGQRISKGWRLQWFWRWKTGTCWKDVAVKALGNMKLRELGKNASQRERNPINELEIFGYLTRLKFDVINYSSCRRNCCSFAF
jgi:hypothetical protein